MKRAMMVGRRRHASPNWITNYPSTAHEFLLSHTTTDYSAWPNARPPAAPFRRGRAGSPHGPASRSAPDGVSARRAPGSRASGYRRRRRDWRPAQSPAHDLAGARLRHVGHDPNLFRRAIGPMSFTIVSDTFVAISWLGLDSRLTTTKPVIAATAAIRYGRNPPRPPMLMRNSFYCARDRRHVLYSYRACLSTVPYGVSMS